MATFYLGARNVDIELLFRDDVNASSGAKWTVLNSDATAYDFSNKTSSSLKIFSHEGRGSRELISVGEDASSGLSYVSNVISWNDAWADVGLERGDYFYELDYVDSGTTQDDIRIASGKLTIK